MDQRLKHFIIVPNVKSVLCLLLLVNLISAAYILKSLHVLMRLKRIHSWLMGQCAVGWMPCIPL